MSPARSGSHSSRLTKPQKRGCAVVDRRAQLQRRQKSQPSPKQRTRRLYPPYPCLESVLRGLRRLGAKTADNSADVDGLTSRLKKICPRWVASQSDAERLTREFLEEGERLKKCHKISNDNWKLGPDPNQQELAPIEEVPPLEIESDSLVPTEKNRPNGEFLELPKENVRISSRSTPRGVEGVCDRCRGSALVAANGMSNRRLTKLICDILLKDEKSQDCFHCFCDKCLRIKSDRGTKCRLKQREGAACRTMGVVSDGLAEECDSPTSNQCEHMAVVLGYLRTASQMAENCPTDHLNQLAL